MSHAIVRFEPSPFAALERAFASLVTGPGSLAVDGSQIVGLPERSVPLGELRARLLHPSTRYATRDGALSAVVALAQRRGGPWTVGLAGMLLPGLRRAALPLVRACPAKAADIEAEMLAGLLAALSEARVERGRLAGWLTGRAFDAAKSLVRAEAAEQARPAHRPVPAAPPKGYGHPDLVLLAAVAAGVICADDAELIGATRLGGVDLADAAVAWGLTYAAAGRRRARAERALVAHLCEISGPGFVADRPRFAGSTYGGRPRQGARPEPEPGLRPRPETAARR